MIDHKEFDVCIEHTMIGFFRVKAECKRSAQLIIDAMNEGDGPNMIDAQDLEITIKTVNVEEVK